jgi:hypothetical protein
MPAHKRRDPQVCPVDVACHRALGPYARWHVAVRRAKATAKCSPIQRAFAFAPTMAIFKSHLCELFSGRGHLEGTFWTGLQ